MRTCSLYMGRTLLFIIVLHLGFLSIGNAQDKYRLTLDEVVALAQSDAPDALLAATRWKRSYWTYQSFLADFKPQILLNANTLPHINRSVEPITLPNGNLAYISRSFMHNSVDLSLQQDFAPTGARGSDSTRLAALHRWRFGSRPCTRSPFQRL